MHRLCSVLTPWVVSQFYRSPGCPRSGGSIRRTACTCTSSAHLYQIPTRSKVPNPMSAGSQPHPHGIPDSQRAGGLGASWMFLSSCPELQSSCISYMDPLICLLTLSHSTESTSSPCRTFFFFNCSIVATHSSSLAWEILWTAAPSRLQSMGSQELDTA